MKRATHVVSSDTPEADSITDDRELTDILSLVGY
jgi:hypothetical protein